MLLLGRQLQGTNDSRHREHSPTRNRRLPATSRHGPTRRRAMPRSRPTNALDSPASNVTRQTLE
jgi:hypothetical protein